jgi:RecG-like helicase
MVTLISQLLTNHLEKPIQTVHRFDSNRLKVWKFIRDEIGLGRQIYIVYTRICKNGFQRFDGWL